MNDARHTVSMFFLERREGSLRTLILRKVALDPFWCLAALCARATSSRGRFRI